MSKIRLGVLGGGGDSLIGVLHRVASFMYDRYEIVGGVFNPNYEENIKFAEQIGVNTDRVYKDFEEFIEVEASKPEYERIEAVSVLTPNFLHFPMAKKLLENGFNVICEKPLTTTLEEAYIFLVFFLLNFCRNCSFHSLEWGKWLWIFTEAWKTGSREREKIETLASSSPFLSSFLSAQPSIFGSSDYTTTPLT